MVGKNSKPQFPKKIVLFDGVCNLCNYAVNFIIDRDPQAKFVFGSLQSAEAKRLLQKYGLASDHLDSLVLIKGDKVFVKSNGALEIARDLNGLWPFFYIFKLIPYPIRDIIYNLVARYRYRFFGKTDTCRYPTKELKTRFLNN